MPDDVATLAFSPKTGHFFDQPDVAAEFALQTYSDASGRRAGRVKPLEDGGGRERAWLARGRTDRADAAAGARRASGSGLRDEYGRAVGQNRHRPILELGFLGVRDLHIGDDLRDWTGRRLHDAVQ